MSDKKPKKHHKETAEEKEKRYGKQLKYMYSMLGVLFLYLGMAFGSAENVTGMTAYLGKSRDITLGEILANVVAEPFHLFPFSIYHVKWILIFGVLFAFLAIFRYSQYLRFKETKPNETHGTSKWNEDFTGFAERYTKSVTETCHDEHILDKLRKTSEEEVLHEMPYIDMNMMITSKNKLSFDNSWTKRNNNTVILGGSGTGKSFSYIEPNIAQLNSSFVITDPSGEIYQNMYRLLEAEGYVIKVLNLKYYNRGNHYNPFDYIRRKEDGTCDQTSVMAMVAAFLDNTGSGKEEAFWRDSANALFCAAAFLLIETRPYKDWTMANVSKIIRQARKDESSSSSSTGFDILMQKAGAKNPNSMAYSFYQTFKLASQKTAESILVSTDVKLSKFSIPEINELTTTDLDDTDNNVNLNAIGDRKTALFIITQTGGGPCDFLASMLYNQLFDIVYDRCESFVPTKFHIYSRNGYPLETMFFTKEEAESRISEIKESSIRQDAQTKEFYLENTKGKAVLQKQTSMNPDIDKFRKQKKITFRSHAAAEFFLRDFRNTQIVPGSNKMPWAITCLLDEFNNIGEIPKFDQILATCRKYNLNISIVLQNLAQLKGRYKDAWNTILGNCDNFLFLGSNEFETCKYVSDILGDATIISRSASRQSGKNGSASYNFSNMARKLLNPTELAQLDNDLCIYVMRGELPFKVPKINFKEHINYPRTGCCKKELQMTEADMKTLYMRKKKTVRKRNRHRLEEKQEKMKPAPVRNEDDILEAVNAYTPEEAKENVRKPEKQEQNTVEQIRNMAQAAVTVAEDGTEEWGF